MIINSETFRIELERIITSAKEEGKRSIEVISGDLHRLVGGYPAKDHKMPTYCDVMKNMMKHKDEILYQPPKSRGATLKIRYYL